MKPLFNQKVISRDPQQKIYPNLARTWEKVFLAKPIKKKNYYDINDREAKKLPQAPVSDRVNLQLNLLMRIIR